MKITLPDPAGFADCFASVTNTKLKNMVTGIATDSRVLEPGDLYIALPGINTDGHNFISDVESEGCTSALVSCPNSGCKDIQQVKVNEPLNTIGQIASEWRASIGIPVVGVTGTNGKTSTKELLNHILSSTMNVHATKGNFNTSIGVPLTLLTMTKDHHISILEMGANQRGDIKYLCEIAKPNHGLITNIAPAHLEGFGSIDDIAEEKGELFKNLSDGYAFVNMADEKINELSEINDKITYGLTPDCDFPADIITEKDGNLTLIIDSEEIPTDSRNFSFLKNVIASASVSITLGINWNDFRERIITFSPPNGRCQVKRFNSITIIDDTYNANLESTLASLDYLNAFGGDGRNIFIFGDMLELGNDSETHHRKIGKKCIDADLDAVFLVGEETKFADKELNSSIHHQHFKSKEKLIESLKNSFINGDKILIKGSRGMAMETIIKDVFS